MAANERLMNATVLYERMISLRNISHTQMLRARGMIYTCRYIKAHVCICDALIRYCTDNYFDNEYQI